MFVIIVTCIYAYFIDMSQDRDAFTLWLVGYVLIKIYCKLSAKCDSERILKID